MRKNKGSDADSFFGEDHETFVASAQDCTGLTPGPIGNQAAEDSYEDIYDIPLAITNTEQVEPKKKPRA